MTDKYVKMDKLIDKSIKAGQRADLYNYNLDHVYCSDNSNYRDPTSNLIQSTAAADVKMLRKENKQLQTMLLLHLDLIQEQSNQLIAKDKQLLQLREENERLRAKTERNAAIERQQRINKHGKMLNTSGGSPTIDSYFTSDTKTPQRPQHDSVLSNTKENFKTIRNTSITGDAKQNRTSANEPRNGEIHFQSRTIRNEAIVMPTEHIKINKITAQTKERPNLLHSPASTISTDKCYSVKYQQMPANANFVGNDKGKLINKIILQRKKSENGEKIFVRAKSVDMNIKRMDTEKWITVKSIKSEGSTGRTDVRKLNSGETEMPLSTSLLLNNNGGRKADANVHFNTPNSADKSRKSSDKNVLPFNGHDNVVSILNETVNTPAPTPTPTPPISPCLLSVSVPVSAPTTTPSVFPLPPVVSPVVKIEAEDLDFGEYGGLLTDDADDESKKSDSIMVNVKEDLNDFGTSGYAIKSPLFCVLSPSTSPISSSPRPMPHSNIPSPIIGSTILYPAAKRIVPRNSYITTSKLYKTREWQLDEIEVETKQMITDEIHKEDEENEANLELPKWRTWEMSSNRDAPAPREWEDLSDDMFSKRHARFLQDERKRKKWDVQRIREQRTIERLKRRHCKDEINQQKDDEMYSFFPSADQLRSIQISDDLPVSAFGELVPLLPMTEFMLPWHSVYGIPQSMLSNSMSIASSCLTEFKHHTNSATCHFDAAVTNVSSIVFLPKKRTGRSKIPVSITPNLIIPKHANIQ